MLISDISIAQFTSASSAGVVNVQLGFVPDFAVLYVDVGGTNPNMYTWANHASLSLWPATLNLLTTGSTGVVTAGTSSGIVAYAGGDTLTAGASVNDDPKYVDENGDIESFTAAEGGDNTGAGPGGAFSDGNPPLGMKHLPLTRAGLKILAALQVNSGINILVAYRRNR